MAMTKYSIVLVFYSMETPFLNELNEQQLEAALYFDTPLLILAGAGSGKTKTLTYKAAYLMESGKAKPEQLLLLTFTNKAAGVMKDRIAKLTGKVLSHAGTFHSLGARILRRDGYSIGVEPDFVIYDAGDQLDLVKAIFKELDIADKRVKPASVLYTIAQSKQELIDPETFAGIARGPYQETAARVYREYEKKKRKYKALDFEDLLLQTVNLFSTDSAVLQKYQERLPYVFVDEYQDTNLVQYKLTKMIVGQNKQLTVVGDASQSIYRWRGADYRNMMKLRSDYENLKEIRLERNYRSTQNILDAASVVIAQNTGHPVLKLWTDKGKGEKITLLECETAHDEGYQVLAQMRELRMREGYSWSDFAILYRTNAQSRAFEEVFVRDGVPYVLVGGVKFYERKEIKDLLAYIRLVQNSEDGVSLGRVEKLGKRKMRDYLEFLGNNDKLKERPPAEILESVLKTTKYEDQYNPHEEEDMARLENIKELQAVATEFETLTEFLENVALVQSEYYSDEMKNQREAVTFMTLHAAKGLEFPVVFMVGMEEGLFPHSRSIMETEELEEERRLCYVGMTRAQKKLYITFARRRMVYGAFAGGMPSRFINEIDSELIEMYATSSLAARFMASQPEEKTKPKLTREIRVEPIDDQTIEDFLSGEASIDDLLR